MNAVLYTHDFEPITVVDIPMWLWDKLKNGYAIRLAVENDFSKIHANYEFPRFKCVEIYGEIFRKSGKEALVLFTRDEEHAMALKSAFLPGQHKEAHRRENAAFDEGFGKGFLEALYRIGFGGER